MFKKKEKETKRTATKKEATGFTVLLIPNSTDAARTREISYDTLVKWFAGAVAVGIIIVGLFVSMMVHNYNLRATLVRQQETIDEVKDTNVRLGQTISSLNDQITEDKEAFDKIKETIDKKAEENRAAAEEAAIPAGVPIRGSGVLAVEDPNVDKGEAASNGIVFSANTGAVIAATGTGTIESIAPDTYYTNKIVIDHGNGYRSVYRFIGDVSAKDGSSVNRNDMIAVVTEDSLVSYEIILNGAYTDPRTVMVTE